MTSCSIGLIKDYNCYLGLLFLMEDILEVLNNRLRQLNLVNVLDLLTVEKFPQHILLVITYISKKYSWTESGFL